MSASALASLPQPPAQRVRACLAGEGGSGDAAQQLRRLVDAGCDRLPLPGQGATLARWQALAAVAAHDLSLAKLYEGHTDALAILAELGGAPGPAGALWGTWAAEAPTARATLTPDGRLRGAKAWCSGAASLTHALLTAWRPGSEHPQLVAVALRQPGVRVDGQGWQAVGMAGSATAVVHFDDAPATAVGAEGAYLDRPGFWQGGAGIAACWWGSACAIGQALHRAARQPSAPPWRQAALGRADVALQSTAALLRAAAAWIDAHPRAPAQAVALRTRQSAERTARTVLDEAGQALGAAPFCQDAAFARHAADLPVFIRQSHGPKDDAALGQLAAQEEAPWTL